MSLLRRDEAVDDEPAPLEVREVTPILDFAPKPGFVPGSTQTFKYVLSDGITTSREATVTFRAGSLEFEEKGKETHSGRFAATGVPGREPVSFLLDGACGSASLHQRRGAGLLKESRPAP